MLEAKSFFQQVELLSIGLEQVRLEVEQEQYSLALKSYREYFHDKLKRFNLKLTKLSPDYRQEADLLLQNRISLLNSPLIDIGSPIDWLMVPGEDKQWQSHLVYFYFPECLIHAYLETKDRVYLDKWCMIVTDFIHNVAYGVPTLEYDPAYPKYLTEDEQFKGGEGRLPGYYGGPWISLSSSTRVNKWLASLCMLADVDEIPDELFCLILHSIVTDHAYNMINNPRSHPNQYFHVSTALSMLGIFLSEFKIASACYLIGMQRIEHAVEHLLLPDGSDLEQSFNYNKAIPNFFHEVLCLYGNEPTRRISALLPRIKDRCLFLANITTPLKQWPNIAKQHLADATPQLARWAEQYDLPEISQLIDRLNGNSNEDGVLSVFFPYGGFYVMRSGWERDSLYMMYKASRLSVGHMHEDCNSIFMTAYGRNLLIDSGNYNYSDDERSIKINAYFYSSLAHNTISVDGASQKRLERHRQGADWTKLAALKQPIRKRSSISPDFDFVEGEYNDGYDHGIQVAHERQIMFVKDLFWIVTDRLRSCEPHHYTLAWQFPANFRPDQIDIHVDKQRVRTTDPQGANLEIYHFSANPMALELKYGESTPYAGWSTSEYDQMTESADILGTWHGTDDQLVVSLLFPHRGEPDDSFTITNLANDPNCCGFLMEQQDGNRIAYIASLTEGTLTYRDFNMTGEALLLRWNEQGSLRGMALSCEKMSYDGQPLDLRGETNFHFEVADDGFSLLGNFQQ